MKPLFLLFAVSAFLGLTACAPDAYPDPDWRTSTPEAQGIDSRFLVRLMEHLRDRGLNVDGVLVARHGYLVFESYAAPYDRSTVHNVKSVSKSILSALVGIALRDRVFTGLDQRVGDILPEYASAADPRKRETRLRNLLTMTAGIDLEENSPEFDRVFESRDWVRAIAEVPLRDDPGRRFNYNTALTHLMSATLTRRTGMSAEAFARKTLFGPLGIGPCLWRKDPQGNSMGGSELFLTPRDMARFGFLYLKKGTWEGRPLVPRDWVAESTRAQVDTRRWDGIDIEKYGYWWWLPTGGEWVALGWGGQMILVDPALDLVAVFTSAEAATLPLTLYSNYIKPAVRAAALPPNEAAAAAIAVLAGHREHPQPQPAPPLLGLARRISGRTYRLDRNPLGLTSLRFDFAEGKDCSLAVGTPEGTVTWPTGLDGTYRLSAPSTEGLRVACRGSWTHEDPPEFQLDYRIVGEPFQVRADFAFRGRDLVLSVVRTPVPIHLELRGTRVQ